VSDIAQRTVTIEEAGRILGVGRSAAYSAAKAGEIPTIKVGRRLIVPVAKLRAMLGENENSAPAADRDAVQNSGSGNARHEVSQV